MSSWAVAVAQGDMNGVDQLFNRWSVWVTANGGNLSNRKAQILRLEIIIFGCVIRMNLGDRAVEEDVVKALTAGEALFRLGGASDEGLAELLANAAAAAAVSRLVTDVGIEDETTKSYIAKAAKYQRMKRRDFQSGSDADYLLQTLAVRIVIFAVAEKLAGLKAINAEILQWEKMLRQQPGSNATKAGLAITLLAREQMKKENDSVDDPDRRKAIENVARVQDLLAARV